MKISKLYQLIGNDIVEIPLIDVEELNDRLLNIENNYLKKTGDETKSGKIILTDSGHFIIFSSKVELSDTAPESLTGQDLIVLYDKNNTYLGAVYSYIDKDNNLVIGNYVQRTSTNNVLTGQTFGVGLQPDGTPFAIGPNPRENTYAKDVDTLQASINRHPVNINVLTPTNTFYLGGSNASDTANLWQGRGTSPEMPFATLTGIYTQIKRLHVIGAVYVKVQGDINISTIWMTVPGVQNIDITSLNPDQPVKIKSTADATRWIVADTLVSFSNIDFEGISLYAQGELGGYIHLTGNVNITANSSTWSVLSANYAASTLTISGNVNLSGSCGIVASASHSGTILVNQNATLSGNITGKRYSSIMNGTINVYGRGANAFPGTIDGTCDANSKYF